MRIGVDPKWYPLEFGPQTAYVNGYTEELLLEMARYSGMEFELIEANWDTLVDGLKEKKYDAILSSLPPYEYNMAKFDFSKNFLDLGPVLILRTNEKEKALDQMKGKMIGIISGDQSALLLGKCVVREYRSIPALLNGVAVGEIDGALLSQIPAVNFVKDLYANQLKIVGLPLTEAGLHLVALKGKGNSFNKTLQSMKKNKAVEKLLKKWNLS
jgi:polar amino acid transport system substrate-binding protein